MFIKLVRETAHSGKGYIIPRCGSQEVSMQRVHISRNRYLQGGSSNKPITRMSRPSIDTAPYNISNTKYGFIHSSQKFSFIPQALWVLLLIMETHHKATSEFTKNEQTISFIFFWQLLISDSACSIFSLHIFLFFCNFLTYADMGKM